MSDLSVRMVHRSDRRPSYPEAPYTFGYETLFGDAENLNRSTVRAEMSGAWVTVSNWTV